MKNNFWLNIRVYQAASILLWYCKKFKRLSNWLEILRFLYNLPCYQSCEQLIDLSHQTLKACLITVTDRLGTNIVCLEKLPSFSENLDKEIGLFKPLKGVIKTVLLELEDFFDSSWNRPIKENSIAELLLIIIKNLVMIWVSSAHNAAELQTSTRLVKVLSSNFSGWMSQVEGMFIDSVEQEYLRTG